MGNANKRRHSADGAESHLSITSNYWSHQDYEVFRWVGETLLESTTPDLVEDLALLQSDTGSEAHRIDIALAARRLDGILDWCALEIKAEYFCQDEVEAEFQRIQERLVYQLQTKVPTIRRWGKKMAVVVDRPFFDAIGDIPEVPNISNGDIVWFVVRLEEDVQAASHRIVRDSIHVTTLERATEGLTGGSPVFRGQFEDRIRAKIGNQR